MLRIDREERYYIDFCDSNCAALVQEVMIQKGKRKGEMDFVVRGYYGSLDALLRGYVEASGKEPAGSLKEIIERLKKIQRVISSIDGMTRADFKGLMAEEGKGR